MKWKALAAWRERWVVLLAAVLLYHADGRVLRGQDLPFDSGSTGADGAFDVNLPFTPSRSQHAMSLDAAREQLVLFGGYSPNLLNDTWIWQGKDWMKLNLATMPAVRAAHSMVYDVARQQVVLFGGTETSSGVTTNDTWVWNGTNWLRKNPTNRPSNRFSTAMAYDSARREVVLFGGRTDSPILNDTWGWNGTNWIQRIPSLSPPSPRFSAAMAYDQARHEMVLFGGNGGGGICLSDTWVWDGTNWNPRFPANPLPACRSTHVMSYDVAQQQVLMFGGSSGIGIVNDTWIWDGSNWRQQTPRHTPGVRWSAAAAYDSVRGRIVLTGGTVSGQDAYSDTWAWDGNDWLAVSGGLYQTFDISSKPDGTWNFTTITVPAGLTVLFKNNQGNTPVRWLATGDVRIDGTIDLDGRDGGLGGLNVAVREGGPGGFAGGLGGLPSFMASPFAGTPGQGPGGGAPGTNSAQNGVDGTYASTYGNPFIQPLIGGSGGGGSASTTASYGNLGGGGGGALLLSSSRDITINGTIRANGGVGFGGSGNGAGGAMRLRADRITFNTSARLEASPDGRIRLESYERSLTGTILPTNAFNLVVSIPVADPPGGESALRILNVAGSNVVQPPGGDLMNPDVTFSQLGDITVTVQGQNVPDGTPVRLRLTMTGAVINKPAGGEPNVVLGGGTATFTLTVPRGRGTIQAFAEFTVNSP